jgi:inner membrane protein
MLPDLDVVGMRFGIAYGSEFGHRGFSHSLLFALAVALTGCVFHGFLRSNAMKVFSFLFAATASHGILDAFTNGGHGIEFLWPFSPERFFAPYQVIQVSPLGLSRFLSWQGLAVLRSEAIWVWLPCIAVGFMLLVVRRMLPRDPNHLP